MRRATPGYRVKAGISLAPRDQPDGRLDVVIVNWNSGGHLERCLASLEEIAAEVALRVVVVDNASTDGSEEPARVAGDWLVLVPNAGNRGFAAACNQGAAAGSHPVILFLNPDTIVPSAAPLRLAMAALAAADGTKIVGVQLRDARGAVTRSCSRFPTPWRVSGWSTGLARLLPRVFPPQFQTDFDHASDRDVEVVMGAFLMTSRALFSRLGGFDERFFVYYEEVDLACRARGAGHRTRFLAGGYVIHTGHGSSHQVPARRLFYALRSRMVYGHLHFTAPAALFVSALTLLVEPGVRVLAALLRGDIRAAGVALRAAWLLWTSLGSRAGAQA